LAQTVKAMDRLQIHHGIIMRLHKDGTRGFREIQSQSPCFYRA
jgi:hypothetical protein